MTQHVKHSILTFVSLAIVGHGDMTFMRRHVGCAELLATIQQRVRPKLNVFGHIHEGLFH